MRETIAGGETPARTTREGFKGGRKRKKRNVVDLGRRPGRPPKSKRRRRCRTSKEKVTRVDRKT